MHRSVLQLAATFVDKLSIGICEVTNQSVSRPVHILFSTRADQLAVRKLACPRIVQILLISSHKSHCQAVHRCWAAILL